MRLWPAKAKSILSMPRTSSTERSWRWCGVSAAPSSRLPPAVNASMFSARSTLSRISSFVSSIPPIVNAQSVCDLLDKLRIMHPLDTLTLVLDNARYQHCKMVLAHAAKRGIRLLFLPPYSHNLNLIERLWKFIKKDSLHGRYYPTHQPFQAAILESINAINTRHKDTLKTTPALNFQMFDKVQLLAA